MLRIALFSLVAAFAYWVVAGEEYLGTLGLLCLGLGPGFAGLVMYSEARKELGTTESRRDLLRRFAALPRPDPPRPHHLAADHLPGIPRPTSGRSSPRSAWRSRSPG